jgi:hypothetical protein
MATGIHGVIGAKGNPFIPRNDRLFRLGVTGVFRTERGYSREVGSRYHARSNGLLLVAFARRSF